MSAYHDQVATTIDGTSIAWSRRGGGSPIVFVHGVTDNARSFEPIVDELTGHHEAITLDLRGHGESGTADHYDIASMVTDVLAVTAAAGLDDGAPPVYVGHALGGVIVSALGAVAPYHGILCIDQSLQLDSFKSLLTSLEPQLRDSSTFDATIDELLTEMAGPLDPEEIDRLRALRRANQNVVLGVWDRILSESAATIAADVDVMLSGYERLYGPPYPEYLLLRGSDPGGDPRWLGNRIPGVTTITWKPGGHYPHLLEQRQAVELIKIMCNQPLRTGDPSRQSQWRAQS